MAVRRLVFCAPSVDMVSRLKFPLQAPINPWC